MEKYYTPEELARQFKLNRMTIYRFLRSGKIPSVRIGKSYRISESHLQNWLVGQKPQITIPKVVLEFLRLLQQSQFLKEKIVYVILFGSHARGDANENSDIDLLIIEKDLTQEEHDQILDFLTDAELTCEDDISLMTRTEEEWKQMQKTKSGLYQQLLKEGYALWPRKTPMQKLMKSEPLPH